MHEIRLRRDPQYICFTLPGDVSITTVYPSMQSQGSLLRLVKRVYEQGLKDGGLAAAKVTEAPPDYSAFSFSGLGGT